MGLSNRRVLPRPLFSLNEVRRRVLMRRGTMTQSSWRRALRAFGDRCAYCGVSGQNLQRDHVIPLSRGGLDNQFNVVPACADCNKSKGNQDVRFWMRARGLNYEQFRVRFWLMRKDA